MMCGKLLLGCLFVALSMAGCGGDDGPNAGSGWVTIDGERTDLAWFDCARVGTSFNFVVTGQIDTETNYGFVEIDTGSAESLFGFKVTLVERDPVDITNWIPGEDETWTADVSGDTSNLEIFAETKRSRPSGDEEGVPVSVHVKCPGEPETGGGTYAVDGQSVDASEVRCNSNSFEARERGFNLGISVIDELNSGFSKPPAVGVFPTGEDDEFLLYAHSRSDGREIDAELVVKEVLFNYEGGRVVSTPAAEALGVSFDLRCGLGPPPEIDISLDG